MLAYKFWAWLKFIVAFALSAAIFALVCLFNSSAFPLESDKEYYLYSSSSQSLIVKTVDFADLPYVKGECARVETENGNAYLEKILAHYGAAVLKTERFDDGISYYCYSPKLKNKLLVDGAAVNLHIVVKPTEVLLGTPVIFGGY